MYCLFNCTVFQDLQIKNKKVILNLSSFQRYREERFREKLKQPTLQDVTANYLTGFKKKTTIARDLLFFFICLFFQDL